MNTFKAAIPLLAVPDVEAALGYYEEKLGFCRVGRMGEPPSYGIAARDGQAVHFVFSRHPEVSAPPLGRGLVDEGQGGIYFEVEDVDACAGELVRRGAAECLVPEDKAYGMRDFWIRDLNGYLLAFGQRL